MTPATPETPPAANVDAGTGPKTWKVGTLTYTSAGLVMLFGWLLLGDFAWSMRDRSIAPMASWYLDHLEVPKVVFGLLLSSFPVFLGLILGPVISVKSDHHRGKWGRRIPFLLVTTPLAAFGMLGLASTPFIAKWVHGFFPQESEMIVSVVCFGVFWAAFELATIAGGAVFGGLINDVVPKQLLGRFYGMFRAISLIDGIIFNYWLTGKIPTHFSLIMAGVGIYYGVTFMFVCLKVKEGDYPPPPAVNPSHNLSQRFSGGIKAYFRECFSQKYYLMTFLLFMFAGLAFIPVSLFSVPYARSLGVSMDTYGNCVALTYIISLCLSYFLGWLADLIHPLRMAIFTMLGYTVVTVLGSLYGTTANAFLAIWVAHAVFAGCYLTSAASLSQRLFPHGKYAQFHSAAGLTAAPLHMLLAPLLGVIIDVTNNNYRILFMAEFVLAGSALVTAFYVHRRFMQLGGPKGYVAPE
jgi:MFS family permease